MIATQLRPITALEAQAAANLFLSDNLPDRFYGSRPTFDSNARVWRVPVLLTYPIIGPVGQTGEILVSATSEEIIAFTPLNEMISAAAELYLQHCDAIESAFRNMPRTAPLTAFEAQAAANLFLSDNLPDRFCADDPTLDNTANVWRVPVILAYPFIGSIGQVGEICVSTSSEQIISYTPLEEMRAAATPLIEQHRDAIEAPVP